MKPWNDPEMRWALNYAIDRDQIVKIAYEGTTSKSRIFPAYPPIQRLDKLLETKGIYKVPDYGPLTRRRPWRSSRRRATRRAAMVTMPKMASSSHDHQDARSLHREAAHRRCAGRAVPGGGHQRHACEAGRRTWDDNLNIGKFETQMGWQMCGSINEPWASLDTLNASGSSRWASAPATTGGRWQMPELQQARGSDGHAAAGRSRRSTNCS